MKNTMKNLLRNRAAAALAALSALAAVASAAAPAAHADLTGPKTPPPPAQSNK